MKNNIALIVAIVALLGFGSCKKEENGKVLFRANIESPAQQIKTDIASNGTMTWRSGDQISVFYGTSATSMSGVSLLSTSSTGRTAEFTLMSGSEPTGGHYYAVYPAGIAGFEYNTITLPSTQEYHAAEGGKVLFEAPMYAYSNNDQLVFKNLCGVVRLTLTAPKSISRIVIRANEPLCGQFTVNWNNGTPTMAATSTDNTEVEFTCGSGVDCTNGTDFYVYLPVNETGYTGMEFLFCADDFTTCSKTLKSDQHFVVGRNTLNPLVFSNPEFRPTGSKGGLFTINADGDKVWFSQGNLQYQASSGTWRFAANQYDYVGADNSNISENYSGWIDLFGWGTGNNPTLHTEDNNDYPTFVDWGSTVISNGGNTANSGWRTLSQAEWDYLFNTRENTTNLGTANARYVKVRVNNTYGLMLFPDGYVHPTGVITPVGINIIDDNGSSNNYTFAQWAEMESAGAVFLPAAGDHWGSDVENVGICGGYWSSTPYTESGAYVAGFDEDIVTTDVSRRYLGWSVRPVRDND